MAQMSYLDKMYRKRLKCPRCKKKNFYIFEIQDRVEVVCKNCDEIFIGFKKKI